MWIFIYETQNAGCPHLEKLAIRDGQSLFQVFDSTTGRATKLERRGGGYLTEKMDVT
ncbi:hypothetical protein AGABI2DRAFT_192123 [Agaricus bisporus var. bisporus H97]|uniref:hypothetical protein n=1 Tax=Agaricus bisporus var. bisporus (strain H97 / ATCC MYA-4626 / FGSC 10389) TaxID=936046 RepID=UPI00029F4FD3|nr:hypothetical protein AGABI2DRAFT_192123 [Agaricus bisporus var. bisporus H97]EKV48534.1 hypothetical protein AGABI2DRAFT_192123 [Agaricus bisporus var. bisporus H97]